MRMAGKPVAGFFPMPSHRRSESGTQTFLPESSPAHKQATHMYPTVRSIQIPTQSLIESADGRVTTVATRRREKTLVQRKNKPPHLTPTGLLTEGDYTH